MRQLAKIAKKEGKPAEAEEYERRADAIHHNGTECEAIRATSHLIATRQNDQAIDELEKYLDSKEPKDRALAARRIVGALTLHPKRKNATELLVRVEKITGVTPRLISARSSVLIASNQLNEALALIERGLEDFPEEYELYVAKLRSFKAAKKISEL